MPAPPIPVAGTDLISIADMPARLADDTLHHLDQVDVATIGHRDKVVSAGPHIQSLQPGAKIAGTAVTLKLHGRDSALLHHAIGLCRPGDILVIDRGGDDTHACLGGGVAFAAKLAGIAGAVIDGPATDPSELAEIGFPVWARGVSPVTTTLIGKTGSLNHTVTIARAEIDPGMIVLADDSGVVFLPPDTANDIATWAIDRQIFLTARRDKLRQGTPFGELSGASQKVLDTLRAQEDRSSLATKSGRKS